MVGREKVTDISAGSMPSLRPTGMLGRGFAGNWRS
jgi:hypothetical protein